VRVYPYPGQARRALRQLTVSVFAPDGVSARRFTVGGKPAVVRDNEVSVTTNVCVAAHAPGTVDVRVDGASQIPNDPSTLETFAEPRAGGVEISRIYLSGQIGGAC
jgi:hypothetical protein